MNFDPNIAYVILVLAFILEVLALMAPGTGFLEVGALAMMAVAGYALLQLPINAWALVILIIGLFFFFVALRWKERWRQWLSLGLAVLAFWIGTVFMFRQPMGSELAINPWLAGFVSLVGGFFMWFVFNKGIEASLIPTTHNISSVIGMEGTALTAIGREGSVQINGEAWSGRSRNLIPIHKRVRVLARNGLILEVEEIKEEQMPAEQS